jgi:protein-tyrosine-phosphatase
VSDYTIILVGENNLTRSILAEAILKKIFQQKNIENVNVISRGSIVLFSEPISPKASAVLYEHGCEDMSKRSTELTQEDIDNADLILTMSRSDSEHIRDHFEVNTTCMFLGTFIDMEEEIPDVAEDTKEGYEVCYELTKQAMEAAADRLILELIIP